MIRMILRQSSSRHMIQFSDHLVTMILLLMVMTMMTMMIVKQMMKMMMMHTCQTKLSESKVKRQLREDGDKERMTNIRKK